MKSELLKRLRQVEDVICEEPASLGVSTYYLDLKRAYGNPDILNALSHFVYAHLEHGTNCVAARGNGGVPLAIAVSLEYNIRLAIARDSPRQHGTGECWFDGHVPTVEDRISVVDDVFAKGIGTRKTISMIQKTGAKVVGCLVVYKRGEGNLDDLGIPLGCLLVPEDLSKP
jgi:orotate phosphoribosyltransferase